MRRVSRSCFRSGSGTGKVWKFSTARTGPARRSTSPARPAAQTRVTVCGSPVGSMTYAEKDLLPADTILLRKQYTKPSGKRLFVTIVLSGKERVSIHRPQICLVGQGNEIAHSEVVPVPLDGRKPLDVMSLDTSSPSEKTGWPDAGICFVLRLLVRRQGPRDAVHIFSA